ncbi:hypothetical protein [Pygmaiobacter massiliensis]|uniref:hypothetical protein n=1 Tax=Pygmaiobacter massiliensis TaxID=1917873 RepID=UPI000C7B2DC4|nr:hypothetical protein [Pygmaiobacter massiliensis]
MKKIIEFLNFFENLKKKRFLKSLLSIGIIFFILFLPLILEKFLFNGFFGWRPFITAFSEEVWFSFMISYIGALTAVFLGIVTIRQSAKYKKLSDSVTKLTLLPEIFLIHINSSTALPSQEDFPFFYYSVQSQDQIDYNVERQIFKLRFITLNNPIIDLRINHFTYSYYKNSRRYLKEEKEAPHIDIDQMKQVVFVDEIFSIIFSLPKVNGNTQNSETIPDEIHLNINIKYKNQHYMECSKEVGIVLCKPPQGNQNNWIQTITQPQASIKTEFL